MRKIVPNPACDKLALYMSQALKSLPSVKQTVYRGMSYKAELMKLKPGNCFRDLAFMSTGTSYHVATTFAGAAGALMIIEAESSRSIHHLSRMSRETENLLLPGTYLKLISKKEDYDQNSLSKK